MTVEELRELIKHVPDDYSIAFYHNELGLMFDVTSAVVDHEARQLDIESDDNE